MTYISGEATRTNFIVFGLTWPGLEPTIYRTRGEHANQYATDAVILCFEVAGTGDCTLKCQRYIKLTGIGTLGVDFWAMI